MKWVFEHQYLQMLSNQTNVCNFKPREVVGHGSKTQLQVGEHLNN